jgi:dipeptidyl aminopeptidase/acylaminoacyl peptidase
MLHSNFCLLIRKSSFLFYPLLCLMMCRVATAQETDKRLKTLVTQMSRITRCGNPTFSPDGKRLAVVCDLTGIPQVWIVDAAGGWPRLVTDMPNPVTTVFWSPKSDWVAFSAAPGGGLNEQTYLIRPDGTDQRQITDGGKEDNWLDGWSSDGKELMIASNRRGQEGMDNYVVDPFERQFQLTSQNDGSGDYYDISNNGRFALLRRVHSRGNNDLYLVDLRENKETLLTAHTGLAQFTGHLAPGGRTAYLVFDQDRDLSAFGRVQIGSDGQPSPIELVASRDDAELQNAKVNRKGTMVVLVWNVAGRTELSFFDTRSGHVAPGPQLSVEIADADELDFSPDGESIALTLYGSVSPSNVWILNLKTNQLRQVTYSNHPGVDLAQLVRPEFVSYKSEDGLTLTGWLYRPKFGTAPYAFVLSFHGGPETQELPSFHSDYQALLANGIAVFAPNVRGSAGFGKKFLNLDNGALRTNAIRDIKSSVDYLVKQNLADPKRIGIMGGSYGGYMTMAGLTEFPELFAAGADLFGIVNFETFFQHTEPWMAAVSTLEFGDPKTQSKLLYDLSPVHKLDRVRAPLLVLHGANDSNVPVEEAEQVVNALKKRGIAVKYLVFPDEGHGLRNIQTRIQSNVLVTEWFNQYLRP